MKLQGREIWLPAALLCLAVTALGQGAPRDVGIVVTDYAELKVDVMVGALDVLSGGRDAVAAAELIEEVVRRDLEYSGLIRTEPAPDQADSLHYQFVVEGTVEGPLRDAEQTGEVQPTVVSLNLLTWPERQLIVNKRYRPLPSQFRTSAHHFSNQVIEFTTGEPGICLTRVAFSRGTGDRRDLYVVDYDGEGLMRLTANRTLNLCPSWSPDGSEIAFTSYRHGQQGLYSLDTSNGKVRLIIAQEGLNLGADWHPDGQELVLSLSRGGNPEIYRVAPDGRIIRRLTVSKAVEISPSWAPGGRELVFTSDRTGTPQLYIIDEEGAGRRRLSFEGQYNDSAQWSPRGDRIVYTFRDEGFNRIVLIKPSGEERRILTDASWGNAEDPCWAPDGRHVVFASDRNGESKLYVYDVDEDSFRQLTFGDDPDITPAWSR